MTKIAKADVTPGLLCASARYPQVLVLSTPKARGGMVACRVWTRDGDEREVSLPWQTLR